MQFFSLIARRRRDLDHGSWDFRARSRAVGGTCDGVSKIGRSGDPGMDLRWMLHSEATAADRRRSPSAARFDGTGLKAAFEQAFAEPSGLGRNTLKIAIRRQGRLVAQLDAEGVGPETLCTVWSINKGAMTTLTGALACRDTRGHALARPPHCAGWTGSIVATCAVRWTMCRPLNSKRHIITRSRVRPAGHDSKPEPPAIAPASEQSNSEVS